MSDEPPGGAPAPWQPQPPQPPQAPWTPRTGQPPQAAWPPPPMPPPSSPYSPYSPYPYQQPAYVPRRAINGLSIALTVLLVVCALCAISFAIAMFRRASVIDELSFGDFDSSDEFVNTSFGFFILMVLATGVVWIIWQFRHAQNAQRLGVNLALKPGWAIGGWFIPLANLVLPGMQLYQSAQPRPDVARVQPEPARSTIPGVFWVWVVCFDAAFILTSIATVMRPSDDDFGLAFFSPEELERYVRADRVDGISGLLYVAAAIAGIVLVRKLTQRQEAALDAANLARPGPPPA